MSGKKRPEQDSIEPRVRAHSSPRIASKFDLVAAAIALVTGIVPAANSWTPAFPVDDAYVSFAYSLHLASDRGLRLSPLGRPVEAYSDPLWVCLLAAGHVLGFAVPTLAMILDLVLVGLVGGVSSALVRALQPTAPRIVRLLPGLLFALLPATAFSVVAGLETLLFAFLLECSVLWWHHDMQVKRNMGPGSHITCLLLALTRPEGALVWLILVAGSLRSIRRIRGQIRTLVWFLAPMTAFISFRLLYFGQLLPNSVVAKSGLSHRVAEQLDKSEGFRFWGEYWPLLLSALVVIVLVWAVRGFHPDLRAPTGLLLVLGAFELAVSSGDNYPYERYLFLTVPLLLTVTTAGVAQVASHTVGTGTRPTDPRSPGVRSLPALLSLGMIAGLLSLTGYTATLHENPLQAGDLGLHNFTLSHLDSLLRPDSLSRHFGSTYHFTLAGWLERQTPSATIATNEVGIVSYYTGARVIDMWGLGNAHIAHLPGQPGNRADPNYLFEQSPTYVVLLVSGCLCLGVPSDVTYASSPAMDGYHLIDLLYDGNSGLSPWTPDAIAAILFKSDPTITSTVSLDGRIPPAHLVRTLMPHEVESKLDASLAKSTSGGMVSPSRDLSAAGNLALGDFDAIAPGSSVDLSIPPVLGTECRFVVTALGATATTEESGAVETVSAASRRQIDDLPVTVSPGGVSLQSVPLPNDEGPLIVHVSTAAGMLMAEPRVVCSAGVASR